MSSRQDLVHRVNQNTNDIEALYDLSKDTNLRVTEIADQVTEIQQTLGQHSETLASHGEKLDEIGQTLNQHDQKLDEVLGLLRDRP